MPVTVLGVSCPVAYLMARLATAELGTHPAKCLATKQLDHVTSGGGWPIIMQLRAQSLRYEENSQHTTPAH